MNCDDTDRRHRKGPSNFTLSVGGVIGIAGILGSVIATYATLQSDIASMKHAFIYQERINEQLRDEIRVNKAERRETMREFSEKLDRIIEQGLRRR